MSMVTSDARSGARISGPVAGPFRRRPPVKQRGDALLDSMIATVLVLVLGMGPMYVTVRSMVAQRAGVLQQMAAGELRSMLLATPKTDICTATGPVGVWAQPQVIALQSQEDSTKSVSMTVTTLCQTASVVVSGVTVVQVMPTLVGCAPVASGFAGPLVMREGGVMSGEPASCATEAS